MKTPEQIIEEKVEEYLNTFYNTTKENATPEELEAAYEYFYNLLESGQTFTEDETVIQISSDAVTDESGAPPAREKIQEMRQTVEKMDPKQRLQFFAAIALMLLALVIVLARFSGVKISNPFAKNQETVEAVTTPEIDYTLFLESALEKLPNKINEPKFLYVPSSNTTIALYPSQAKLLKSGSAWCKMTQEIINEACWLQGSVLNTIIGARKDTWEQIFRNLKVGEKLELKYEGYSIHYTIRTISETEMDNLTVFRQQEPLLTIVFFELDAEGERTSNEKTRRFLLAYPDQNTILQNQKTGFDDSVVVQAENQTAEFPYNNRQAKVSFVHYPAESGNGLSLYRIAVHVSNITFTDAKIIINETSYAPQSMKNNQDGRVLLFFLDGMTGSDYALILKSGSSEIRILNTIPESSPLAGIHIQSISAIYDSQQKKIKVTVQYDIDPFAFDTRCNCYLIVNNEDIINPKETAMFRAGQNVLTLSFPYTFFTGLDLQQSLLQLKLNGYVYDLKSAPQIQP